MGGDVGIGVHPCLFSDFCERHQTLGFTSEVGSIGFWKQHQLGKLPKFYRKRPWKMVVGRSDFLLGWVLLTFQGRFLLNFREVNKMKTHQATSTSLNKTTQQQEAPHRRLLMIYFGSISTLQLENVTSSPTKRQFQANLMVFPESDGIRKRKYQSHCS